MQKGSTHRVTVQGLGSLGEGLSRLNEMEIFTPKVAPGDEIEVEILGQKKGRYLSRLVQVIKPSAQRVTPACPHFDICGGCDFQHLPYSEQMAWKIRMTKHWIRRSPLEPQLKNIFFDSLESPDEYGYRERVRFQVKNGKLHFFRPHSNDLFEITTCPVLPQDFFETLKTEAQSLPDTRDWSRAHIQSYEIAGHRLQFDDDCFIQANLKMNALMWERIESDILEISAKNRALDLYCGIGNFSIPMRDHFQDVTGVEIEGRSLDWARKNSDRVKWIPGDSAQIVQDLNHQKQFFDFVLLDPPRMGALSTCRELLRLHPPRITYVSCSLESLIPDLVSLVKHGGYRIKRWTVTDLFPQTHHIESVVSLVTK